MSIFNKKKAQTLVEFVLIAALVGVAAGSAFLYLNPDLFRKYFKTSTNSAHATIDSNGQMSMQSMGD